MEREDLVREMVDIVAAFAKGFDGCTTFSEKQKFLQDFPFTGEFDERSALLVATIFVTGLYQARELERLRDKEIREDIKETKEIKPWQN